MCPNVASVLIKPPFGPCKIDHATKSRVPRFIDPSSGETSDRIGVDPYRVMTLHSADVSEGGGYGCKAKRRIDDNLEPLAVFWFLQNRAPSIVLSSHFEIHVLLPLHAD